MNTSRQAEGVLQNPLVQSGALNAERHEGEEKCLKHTFGRRACPGSGCLNEGSGEA